MKRFVFKPRKVPTFSGFNLQQLLSKDSGTYSLDGSLGKRELYVSVRIARDNIYIDNIKISRDLIRELKKRRLYAIESNNIKPLVEVKDNILYQLVLFEGCRTPTLEISGIHMHRVVVDPLFEDSFTKVRVLNPKPRKKVLEICTGLGYSTYWLLKRKCYVVSIEKNETVLKLAEYNPWSSHLENVDIILGDATQAIYDFDADSFDYIFHDPPRFSLAPELYSQDFYEQLFRVLKPRGKIFHYTGTPGEKRGKYLAKGVAERLRQCGFWRVKYAESAKGILAEKPFISSF